MRYRLTGYIVAAVTLLSVGSHAQQKPNFSGTWTAVPDRTPLGNHGGCPPELRGFGRQFTATHTPSTLTIERIEFRELMTYTFKLDGSENKNKMTGGEATSKAMWNGDKLTITTTSVFDTGGGDVATVTMKSSQVLTLEPTGLLSVVSTVSCRDNPPATNTLVYRKAS